MNSEEIICLCWDKNVVRLLYAAAINYADTRDDLPKANGFPQPFLCTQRFLCGMQICLQDERERQIDETLISAASTSCTQKYVQLASKVRTGDQLKINPLVSNSTTTRVQKVYFRVTHVRVTWY